MRLVASPSVTLIFMRRYFKNEVTALAPPGGCKNLLLINGSILTTKRLFVNDPLIVVVVSFLFFAFIVKHNEKHFFNKHIPTLCSRGLEAKTGPSCCCCWFLSRAKVRFPLSPHPQSVGGGEQLSVGRSVGRSAGGGSKCFLICCFTSLDSLNGGTGCDCSDGSA